MVGLFRIRDNISNAHSCQLATFVDKSDGRLIRSIVRKYLNPQNLKLNCKSSEIRFPLSGWLSFVVTMTYGQSDILRHIFVKITMQ